MKVIVVFIVVLLSATSSLYAQEQAWHIQLKPQGKLSASEYSTLLNDAPDFAIDYLNSFAPNSVQPTLDIWLSKEQSKITVDKLIQHIDLHKRHYYSYHHGDDIIIADSLQASFAILPAVTKLSEIKEIAGYKCQLAEVTLTVPADGSFKVRLWYSTAIPSYQISQLPFLETVEGAVLGIDFPPFERSELSYRASMVQETSYKSFLFELPKNMEIIETHEQDVDDAVADSSKDYAELFPLIPGLSYSFVEDNDYGPLFGIKDAQGEFVFAPTCYSLEKMNDDFALLMNTDNKFCLINSSAQLINPTYFDKIYPLSNGNMIYVSGDDEGMLSPEGKYIIRNLSEIDYIQDGKFIFKKDGKYGVITEDASILLKPTFSMLHLFYGDIDKTQSISYELPGNKEEIVTYDEFFEKFSLN